MLAARCSVSILIPIVEVQESHQPDQEHHLIVLSLTENLAPYHSPSRTPKQAFSPQKQVHVSN